MSPWIKKYNLTKAEVAQLLEDFLTGTGGKWNWDDFILGMSLTDKHLDDIRERCAGLSQEFPPGKPSGYCNKPGLDVLREYIKQLRASD